MTTHAQTERGFQASAMTRAQARRSVRVADEGRGLAVLSVPGIHCGGCVASIERALNARPDVVSARVNLTLKQARILLPRADSDPGPIIDALGAMGFKASPADTVDQPRDDIGPSLLRATAVAGFGAANIMLLSVGVWSGAEGATRETFHLVAALIAVPVVAYAGRPFFRSALAALRARRLNMDVPIALAILLATALSLFELARGGEHVFFDAAVTLLFFLLGGRYLDHMMRQRARSAVSGLERLSPKGAMVVQADGSPDFVPLDQIRPGDRILVSANEYVPVDLRITEGNTDLDRSLITGEALPIASGPGDVLEAGTLNLTGQITAVALRDAEDSFLSQMIRMQAAAEQGRSTYVRIADRAARLYAPLVHLTALITFIGWMIWTGGDWQRSAFIAISVLIITCPCALGLAVPVAHVVAAGRLMAQGILMKDGAALERLAEIDGAVFDKTGTLTTGRPTLGPIHADAPVLAAARALAAQSGHPAARAIAPAPEAAASGLAVQQVTELPGLGVSAIIDGRPARLGRSDWVAEIAARAPRSDDPAFAFQDGVPVSFPLTETLRPGATSAIAALQGQGLNVAMLSGDNSARVGHVAAELGIAEAHPGMTPDGKIAFLEKLRDQGHRPLMVGDGLNDAAALAAAHVSMAPASASDAGRMAADFVFLRDGLDAVPLALNLARKTARVVRQNFVLAIIYNCIAVPLAVMGFVTPLVAALAMSISSVVVIANSLRLNGADRALPHRAAAPVPKEVTA
ncbi:heavy metal translocating P-type ATPase [Paracoccus fistulariae]|uniref:Cadmium-translocating P-type ATPase n=1 Tax=Paracoccus fistulariae TaxID=658446 RepID=A0ABY7SIC0_9RHOB|nr:heavy metal translocating P-type ATPase [Paracoccus fistulariae]MDB6182076.1 heavy metal translocating P-type ATPase [Paracoccus fistulariae]WCR06693.1 cadmium-translocating P-type ATPase [Paracoccus fistulariae]